MGKDQLHLLIQKLLKGSIKKNELDELNDWYEENLNSNNIDIISPYSKDEIKERLKSKINSRISHKRIKPTKILLPIAASLLIISSIILYEFNINNQESPNEIVHNYYTSSGERIDILLPDSSMVKLNSNSSLDYNQRNEQRNINLIGEAFFEVKRDENLPFVINTDYGEVKVLGTSFNVDLHDSVFNVFVKSGKVLVSTNNKDRILSKDDHLKFNPKTKKSSLSKGNTSSLKWIENKLIFDGIQLSKALKKFERWYGVEFIISKDIDLDKKINASFNNVSLSEAVTSLEFILDTEISINNNKLVIK